MSTSFLQILQSHAEAPISEARLTHIRRAIRHVDHREDRTAPFQFERSEKMIARWTDGVFIRDPECEEALADLEIMLAILSGTYTPTPNAREVFRAMPLRQKSCQTLYFGIFRNRRNDLVLSFRNPVALARLNDYIATHWTQIAVHAPLDTEGALRAERAASSNSASLGAEATNRALIRERPVRH